MRASKIEKLKVKLDTEEVHAGALLCECLLDVSWEQALLVVAKDCPESLCHFCGRAGHLARACSFGQSLSNSARVARNWVFGSCWIKPCCRAAQSTKRSPGIDATR